LSRRSATRRDRATAVSLVLAASLAGCTSVENFVGDPFVEPAKFQYLRCKDILNRIGGGENRHAELQGLMQRAAAGTGGGAVNWLVYQPEYVQVEAQLRLLRRTAGEKRCADETAKPPPPAPQPAR
jgi:hypothetical protein